MHMESVPFSTYQDLENFLRTQQGPALVVFVSRNNSLQDQLAALRYLLTRQAGQLPMFVLPGGYCDLERVRYNIASYPTYLLLQAGNEVGRLVGRVTGRRLEDFINQAAKAWSTNRATDVCASPQLLQ